MDKNNGSTSALIKSGRGGLDRKGSKFDLRDKVLIGFYALPESTVNEVAVEYYDWQREPYKNAAKRALDLLKLNYIELLDNRACRYTGNSCHVYKITEKGINYLKRKRKIPKRLEQEYPANLMEKSKVNPNFGELRNILD